MNLWEIPLQIMKVLINYNLQNKLRVMNSWNSEELLPFYTGLGNKLLSIIIKTHLKIWFINKSKQIRLSLSRCYWNSLRITTNKTSSRFVRILCEESRERIFHSLPLHMLWFIETRYRNGICLESWFDGIRNAILHTSDLGTNS